ncbi:hypothetical protein GCM10027217_04690 [Pseudomaricurvus hydrocarbonicus]
MASNVSGAFWGIAPGLLLILGMSTYGYANEWSSADRLIPIWAAEHPESPRARRSYAQMLAVNGMYEEALLELDEGYREFPQDLSFPIMSLIFSCSAEKAYRYDVDDLIKRTEEHKATNSFRTTTTLLFQMMIDGHCQDLAAPMQKLVDEMPLLSNARFKRSLLSAISIKSGELYIVKGDYNSALLRFVNVDRRTPSASSAVRLSNLYLMMGELDLAVKFLQTAKDRSENSAWGLMEPRRSEYDKKLQWIRSAQAKLDEIESASPDFKESVDVN